MATVVFDMSMSLDGFIAGPEMSADLPMGVGGLRLHDWLFTSPAGSRDAEIARESTAAVGAAVLGRRMYDFGVGVWNDTPYPVPCFVVTHRPEAERAMSGGAFMFVPDGIEAAVGRATAAAGDKRVTIMGADIARQALAAGLVDEIRIQLAPVLLGAGTRLFDGSRRMPIELTPVAVIESPLVTHLWYTAPPRGAA